MRIGVEASAASNMAGSGVLTRHLVEELRGLGHAVILLDEPRAQRPEKRRPHQRLLNGLRRIRWTQIGLPRAAQRQAVDVLVCPAQIGPAGMNRPLVLFIYDLSFLLQPSTADRLYGLFLRRLVPRLIERADRIVGISEATRGDIRQLFPRAATRADVALPGPGEASELLAARAVDRPDKPYVLMVGTLEPRKNHIRAFEAFQLFREQAGVDWQMQVVGSTGWSYEPILKSVRDLNLEDAVQFLGHVSVPQLSGLYRGAGALFFPSLKEGFGLPILEAMALGCPVITSNRSSMSEVAGGAAELVDPLDVRSMMSGLAAVLTSETRRSNLVLQGQRRALEFSWTSFGRTVERSIKVAAACA